MDFNGLGANDLIKMTGGPTTGVGAVNPAAKGIAAAGTRMAGQSGIIKLLGNIGKITKHNPATMFVTDMVFPDPVADGTLDAARRRGLIR